MTPLTKCTFIFAFVASAASVARAAGRLASWHQSDGGEGTQSCASLQNRGSHFTVQIGVGTPPQMFDVVADTGSDSVIVNSCLCIEHGHCRKEDKCFRGIGHSSSFSLQGVAEGGKALAVDDDGVDPEDQVPTLVISFGSGEVEAIVGSDAVKVGGSSAVMMNSSLLLMVDKMIKFDGPFEGILGLGLPRIRGQKHPAVELDEPDQIKDARGFLQASGIPRFSLCFNSAGQDGVLRFGPPQPAVQLGSIGKVHWGLDLRGVTVVPTVVRKGGKTTDGAFGPSAAVVSGSGQRSAFCDPAHRVEGQDTACGAIPDSGTTLIMAPADQLNELMGSICDAWPKCAQDVSVAVENKPMILQRLLMNCSSWLQEGGLSDLPMLDFHLAGAGSNGTESTVRLSPQSYIMEYVADEVKYMPERMLGVMDVVAEVPTGKEVKVCSTAFSKHDYITRKNGPVWILGTPFFYEYQVGYDLASKPPSVSFLSGSCGTCEGGEGSTTKPPAFLSSKRQRHKRKMQGPWRLKGPPLLPRLDTSLPL